MLLITSSISLMAAVTSKFREADRSSGVHLTSSVGHGMDRVCPSPLRWSHTVARTCGAKSREVLFPTSLAGCQCQALN